ncbi:MAG: cobalamin biosynthesis protein CobQ, partial [Candidatus Tectomicrobia bacterium]|nr:cobalamin biosynthesis protein CobQ [Candidatus Tectomicrobia bacterium]
SPPVTVSADGLAIVRKVDGVVLVVEAENTRWPVVQSVKDRIIKARGNLLGIVFNKRQYHIPPFLYNRL